MLLMFISGIVLLIGAVLWSYPGKQVVVDVMALFLAAIAAGMFLAGVVS